MGDREIEIKRDTGANIIPFYKPIRKMTGNINFNVLTQFQLRHERKL